jgi:hypothetical protein
MLKKSNLSVKDCARVLDAAMNLGPLSRPVRQALDLLVEGNRLVAGRMLGIRL